MGCGCGTGDVAAKATVPKYEISDDPETPKRQYLTKRDADAAISRRQLSGTSQPVTS